MMPTSMRMSLKCWTLKTWQSPHEERELPHPQRGPIMR